MARPLVLVVLVLAILTVSTLTTSIAVAQDSTPSISAGPLEPSTCRVEPRTRDEVETLLAAGGLSGSVDVEREDQLPSGVPPNAEMVSAITALEREFAACLNANDWPRWLALMTDANVRRSVSKEEIGDLYASAATAEAGGGTGNRITTVSLRDIRVLSDGRIGAVVEWGVVLPGDPSADPYPETNFDIYEQVNGRWSRDDEISGFVSPPYDQDAATAENDPVAGELDPSESLPDGTPPSGREMERSYAGV